MLHLQPALQILASHYEVPDDISIGVPFDVVFDVTNDGSSFQDESNARYFENAVFLSSDSIYSIDDEWLQPSRMAKIRRG